MTGLHLANGFLLNFFGFGYVPHNMLLRTCEAVKKLKIKQIESRKTEIKY